MAKVSIDASSIHELDSIIKRLGGKILSIKAEVDLGIEFRFSDETISAVQLPLGVKEKPVPSAEAKGKRKYRMRGVKPDPVELVTKKGYVVRGPYSNGVDIEKTVIRLVNPENKKDVANYTIGSTITAETVAKLRELAISNEKALNHRVRRKQPELPAPAPVKPVEETPASDACSLCGQSDRELGQCKTMKKPHCRGCCDEGKHKVF